MNKLLFSLALLSVVPVSEAEVRRKASQVLPTKNASRQEDVGEHVKATGLKKTVDPLGEVVALINNFRKAFNP